MLTRLHDYLRMMQLPRPPGRIIPHPSTMVRTLLRITEKQGVGGRIFAIHEFDEGWVIPIGIGPDSIITLANIKGMLFNAERLVHKVPYEPPERESELNHSIWEYINGMCGLQYIITTEAMKTSRERTWTKYHWERFYG